jgi:very-short-patch-repair endonuclease
METLRKRARKLRNSATDAERCLWKHLRLRQLGKYKFRRQVPVAGYIADFLCCEAKLIVELDGGQHSEREGYDQRRTVALQMAGYRVVRYWDDDVLLRTPLVLEDILRNLGGVGVEQEQEQ